MICACIAAHARRRVCVIPKFLTMSFRARQAVLSQVIACCAGNAWMHVRIRPLKLGSRRRDILSCRGCHAIHAARGQLHLECHRLGKRWLRSAFCYRSEQGLRGFPCGGSMCEAGEDTDYYKKAGVPDSG